MINDTVSQQIAVAADEMKKAALIQARVACALLRLEGMKALNLERECNGFTLAYDEAAFQGVIDEEGIHHNAVYGLLNE